jgi:tRNA(Ile)-lysidine synthase
MVERAAWQARMAVFEAEALWARLEQLPGGAAAGRYCVAFSGGLDSTVLLAAMAELAPRLSTGSLRAMHVEHGLHPDSEGWAAACVRRCEQLGVPVELLRVDATPGRGESPEARARDVRYLALSARLAPAEVLLTAHHADDQLETVLLQLLRGAGVAGLAAMPRMAKLGQGTHMRPLLGFGRESLREWARRRGLSGWVEDPANVAARFSRSHLRQAVLPGIHAHWRGAAAAVARSARHCAEAARLLDELARIDAQRWGDGEALRLSGLRDLSGARCRNLVRWQARSLGLAVPDERRLATLIAQILGARGDASPEVRWPGVVATRHADRLWLIPEALLAVPLAPRDWPDPHTALQLGPGLGELGLERSTEGGLSSAALDARPWRVRFRSGGERLRLPGRAGSRALKKLLHEAGVPPWLRMRMPLLEIRGALAAAGGRWVDEAWWAPPGTPAWRLEWSGCRLPGAAAFVVGGRAF